MSAKSVLIVSAGPRQVSHIRWLTMPRDRTKAIFLAKEEIAELCFANPRGTA